MFFPNLTIKILKIELQDNEKSNLIKNKEICKLIKPEECIYEPTFCIREVPLPLEEQRELTAQKITLFQEKINIKIGIFKTIPFSTMDNKYIRSKMKSLKLKYFIDPEFPPNDASLYYKGNLDISTLESYPFDYVVQWRRPKRFMDKSISLFGHCITPEGVMQGLLCDSWFSTAVASLARRPALIQRMFVTKKYSKRGIYRLQLYKAGELKEILIDDFIPCYYEGKPMFTRGKENELWVLLLEKAYAKLFGSYSSLINGDCSKALFDFTGMPIENISLSPVFVGAIRCLLFAYSTATYIYRNFIRKPLDLKARYGDNSWVLITGSTSGIGYEMCKQFAERGFNVVLQGRNKETLLKCQKEVQEVSDKIKTRIIVADLNKSTEPSFYLDIVDQCKDIDVSILVNNAGISYDNDALNVDRKILKDMIEVNVFALQLLSQAFVKSLASRKQRSAIINVSSCGGTSPIPFFTNYGATKMFVRHFSFSLSEELKENIDVLCLSPGYVTTRMTNYKTGFDTANVESCVRNTLNCLGYDKETNGYWIHNFQSGLMSTMYNLIPNLYFIKIRDTALKRIAEKERDGECPIEETDIQKAKRLSKIYEEIENAIEGGYIICAKTLDDEYKQEFEFDGELIEDASGDNIFNNYAVLDAQEWEGGEMMINIKSSNTILAWSGNNIGNTALWRDNKIVVELQKGKIIKAKSIDDDDGNNSYQNEGGFERERERRYTDHSISLKDSVKHASLFDDAITYWNYDNSFWISIDKFVSQFSTIEICKAKVMESARLKGKFIKSIDPRVKGQDHTTSMFYYSLDIDKQPVELTIGIHQEDEEFIGSHLRKLLDVGFIILEECGNYYWIHDFSSIQRK